MAVRTKGRRKIVVDDRRYVWYVTERWDDPGDELRVVSEDKSFHATYPLFTEVPFIMLSGRQIEEAFQRGCLRCPRFEIGESITPQSVKNLIQWALSNDKELIRVDWMGRLI